MSSTDAKSFAGSAVEHFVIQSRSGAGGMIRLFSLPLIELDKPMGIFDKIKNAIWGEEEATTGAGSQTPVNVSYVGVDQAPVVVTADLSPASGDPALESAKPTVERPNYEPTRVDEVQNPRTAISEINVATELDRKAAATGQKLNWRTSIVDLMKAVGMDATLEERRELARELGYTGDASDTAPMNTFLHKALMAKLAENGGSVPPDLLD